MNQKTGFQVIGLNFAIGIIANARGGFRNRTRRATA